MLLLTFKRHCTDVLQNTEQEFESLTSCECSVAVSSVGWRKSSSWTIFGEANMAYRIVVEYQV